jgi:hypothetical protein
MIGRWHPVAAASRVLGRVSHLSAEPPPMYVEVAAMTARSTDQGGDHGPHQKAPKI